MTLRESSARGDQVNATSSATRLKSSSAKRRRAIRTVPPSEPVAPSIVSRPPLRAAASLLAQRSPDSLAANHSAPPMIATISSAAIDSAVASAPDGNERAHQNAKPTERCRRTVRVASP